MKDIQTIATGQADDYKSSCLFDYAYFKENYKVCLKSKQTTSSQWLSESNTAKGNCESSVNAFCECCFVLI